MTNRSLGVLLLLAPALAGAQTPQDFAYRAEVGAVAGLNVVTLSEPVYRAAQTHDLRDLRIFNGRGEALPLAPVPAPAVGPGPAHELKIVPLPAQQQARDKLLADFALRVEKDGQRALVELSSVTPAPSASAEEIGGYLVDLRPLRGTSGEFVLHFAADAPDFAGRVELAGSDDLYAWRTLAGAPLVRNRQLGDTIERSVVPVAGVTPFVRVTWSGGVAPRLDGARLVERGTAPPLPRTRLAVRRVEGAPSWLVDVPPALPVVRVQLRAPVDNVAVRVRVFRYEERDAPVRARLALHPRRAPERWVPEGGPRAVFRLDRGGEWIEGTPFALAARTTQLRIDAVDNTGFGAALPIVEVEWQPQRYVFAASGPGPYVLAAGSESTDLKAGPTLDLRSVLPADDPAATRLPSAALAAAAAGVDTGRAARIARAAAWSRYVLWGALAAAVAGLGFMAWRLAGQIKARRDA